MSHFEQNNLGTSSSPYLRQHKDNPVHWQEWNTKTLQYARENNLLIFVSIGYATCHWCHMMASEAFSDSETALYLNKNFVSIKVDREQRPDIDEYFMDFINRTGGHGGWPLNVVLSPEGKPFFAGTYFPHKARLGIKPLQEVLQDVKTWYTEHQGSIREYEVTSENIFLSGEMKITDMVRDIHRAYDTEFGGFGTQTKFPPHNTLLFLLNLFQETKNTTAKEMILHTLDAMADRGLHDHLQGGFFRYCVDREWTIPHFKKMLYDQAMHLWVYSLAFQLFQRSKDKAVIEKIVKCLQETFSDQNGLFYSAHDADTDHAEGATYLWSMAELKKVMDESEFKLFSEEYHITDSGNFEGKNHLIEKETALGGLNKIEAKLLAARNKRHQPFTDKKIVSSWNALIGIALLLSSRYTGQEAYRAMAYRVFEKLLKRHASGAMVAHSSLEGVLQTQEFLEDYAALLLFSTYLHEDAQNDEGREKYKALMIRFLTDTNKFKAEKGGATWFSNTGNGDIQQIPAQTFDHPIPSAVSLVEMAIFRAHKILRENNMDVAYKPLLKSDFHNIVAFFSKGKFHEIQTPKKISWADLPINILQLKGAHYKDCMAFACHEFTTKAELLNSFRTL